DKFDIKTQTKEEWGSRKSVSEPVSA
ncbi:flavin reductase family protein, partial [Rhizobium ruizarguesonis]